MVIPEHAQVSDTDGRHEGTNHLVELAGRGTQNAPERRVPHVEEGFYGSLDRRVELSLILSFVCRRRLEPPRTSILEVIRANS